MSVIRRKLASAVKAEASTPSVIPFPNQQLLRVAQAATFLGTSAWAVRELAREGKLKPVIIGKRHLFDRDDLIAFIKREKAA